MNARQRRRHIRAVKLASHPEVRRWVTFAVARRDRLLHRDLRYRSGSRAARRNAALRAVLRARPDVRLWKLSVSIAQPVMHQTSAPVRGGLNSAEPLLFSDVTLAEIRAAHKRWGDWTQHQTVTGRFTPKRPFPPPHDIPRTPARPSLRDVIVGNDAEHNLVVEPAVYLDLVDRHPSTPPGAPFPAPVITRNLDTLAEDIRKAATVSVDVPDRRHIDAAEIPRNAPSDVYAPVDFLSGADLSDCTQPDSDLPNPLGGVK